MNPSGAAPTPWTLPPPERRTDPTVEQPSAYTIEHDVTAPFDRYTIRDSSGRIRAVIVDGYADIYANPVPDAQYEPAFLDALVAARLAQRHDELRARILAVMPRIERVSDRVYEWPEDEADLHRNGPWRSFTERNEALAEYRRGKAADAVLAALVAPVTNAMLGQRGQRAAPTTARVLATSEDRDAWLQALAEDARDCVVRDAWHRCWWVTSAPEDGPYAVRWYDDDDPVNLTGPTVVVPAHVPPLPLTVLWDGATPTQEG